MPQFHHAVDFSVVAVLRAMSDFSKFILTKPTARSKKFEKLSNSKVMGLKFFVSAWTKIQRVLQPFLKIKLGNFGILMSIFFINKIPNVFLPALCPKWSNKPDWLCCRPTLCPQWFRSINNFSSTIWRRKKRNLKKRSKTLIQVFFPLEILRFGFSFDFFSEPIRALKMDSVGRYVATAGDRQVRIFHNLAGKFRDFLFTETFVEVFHCIEKIEKNESSATIPSSKSTALMKMSTVLVAKIMTI